MEIVASTDFSSVREIEDVYKTWTVTFNQLLDEKSVNKDTCYIEGQSSHLEVDGKQVIISPINPYEYNQVYYLVIKNVESEKGSVLLNEIRMPFRLKDNNIYTQEYLQDLVDKTDCSEEVIAFRNIYNPRREGMTKVSGKYFDMYYPSGEESFLETVDLLTPHMDKVYMMLADLYGYQAKVEVHLIHPEDIPMSSEGSIRADEHITFIWIEENNDGVGSVNNLAELVHEINHNFFGGGQIGDRNMWINEAHAKMVASLYTHHLDEAIDRSIAQWSFYIPIVNPDNEPLPKIIEAERNYLVSENGDAWSWYPQDSEETKAQYAGLKFWQNVYLQNDLDTFKLYLRGLDRDESGLKVLSEVSGDTIEELSDKYGE
jgi:hypothetical protein